MPRGTIRATVLIETILAAFEMDEILYELRDHSAGLNAGRWDYIFSVDQEVPRPARVRPARPRAGDDDRAVHARVHRAARRDLPPARRARDRRHGGVHPEPARRRGQRARARQGARGQAARGRRRLRRHLGRPPGPRAGRDARSSTRVLGDRPNQLERLRDDVDVDGGATCSTSPRRPARSPRRACATNVSVGDPLHRAPGSQGVGAAAIDNLMEDAATAEISRSQIWQWVHHGRVERARRRAGHRRGHGASCPGRRGIARPGGLREGRARRGASSEFLTLTAYAQLLRDGVD